MSKFWDGYFNLDSDFSITGFQNNLYNLNKMENSGLSPIPVAHDYYGPELDYYINNGYKKVALGSFQGRDLNAISYASLKLASAGVKVHLFKGTSYKKISKVPIYSCDSISWTNFAFTGFLLYWNVYRNTPDKTDLIYFEDYIGQWRLGRVKFEDYIFKPQLEEYLFKKLKITFNELLSSDSPFYREIVNVLYYTELEKIINKIGIELK